MTLNKKVINYKILDPVILYNFNIKLDFIRDHIKSYNFFYGIFLGAGQPSLAPKNACLGTGDATTRPPFPGAGGGVTHREMPRMIS
jgi:hypothetical protein